MNCAKIRKKLLLEFTKYFFANADNCVELIKLIEAVIYEVAMILNEGNQGRAAKFMGISRSTLRNKLNLYYDTTKIAGRLDQKPVLTIAGKEIILNKQIYKKIKQIFV